MRVRTTIAAACLGALALAGCKREHRPTQALPAASGVGQPSFAAGGAPVDNRYEENAYAVSQGKTWYRAYNCNGCHAAGGGDIGPPLMDAKWRYGADPASIYATIAHGRPNGMPAFRGKIPDDQIWQLAAYVRSMSGNAPSAAAPTRNDDMHPGPSESRRPQSPPVTGGTSPLSGQMPQ